MEAVKGIPAAAEGAEEAGVKLLSARRMGVVAVVVAVEEEG